MTTAALFTAAHATARSLSATLNTYRQRFATGLRAAWAAAKAPVAAAKRTAYDIVSEVFGADFEVSIWKGGDKVRAYVTAPAQSRAYQQVGFLDLVTGKYSLSVHPSRTSRGREYDALMKVAAAAL